jgi:hypothetical protein
LEEEEEEEEEEEDEEEDAWMNRILSLHSIVAFDIIDNKVQLPIIMTL